MRVAIFSDVHGNVRALEAVLTEIDTRGPFDLIINAGDLVFGGPRPREAMDLLMQRAYPTIMGNTDEWIAGIEQSRSHVVAWARRRLESRHEQFLRRLLPSYRIEPPGGPPLVAVHATPTSVSDVLDPEAPPNVVARMFGQAEAKTLVYGHIHRPYVRRVAGGLVVNSGSVGFPFDGNPHPSFAILEPRDGRWHAEIVRVAYDNEAVAADLLASDHPEADAFARRVRTGRMNP
jgi:predicted phosphodiesterase